MRKFSSPARNEFLEPPPQDQSAATLVLGELRLPCRLLELSIGGFIVMVPNAAAWTGEPVGQLVTHESTYGVRIIKQEARYDGFEATLLRVEESPDEHQSFSARWIIHCSRCCAIGLILAIGYSLVASSDGITDGPTRSRGLRDRVCDWFNPPSTIRQSATGPGESADRRAISIALDDDQHDSNESLTASPVSRGEAPARANDRRELLQAALAAADSQPSRPLNASTLPWLFVPGETSVKSVPRCRMTRSAEDDLQQFAAGLKMLPAQAAADAARSLRDSLVMVVTSPATAVAGFSRLKVIHSTDADIYFRSADGEAELLRVLPVELEDVAAFRSPSPSAAAAHHSLHR